jgi:hypothetical protein
MVAAVGFMFAAGNASAASPIPVTGSTLVSGNTDGSTSATCAPKSRVSAVGFTTTTTSTVGVILHTLSPTPTGVSVGAINLSSITGQLTGTAYCSKLPHKKKKKKKKNRAAEAKKKKKKKKVTPLVVASSTTSLAGVSEGSATATCPTGLTVRTGGFDVPLVGGELHSLVKSAQLIAPNQWQVTADSDSSSTASVTAIALCGKGPAVTPASATTTFASETPHSATATCPAGKKVAFGGFVKGGSNTTAAYVSGLQRTSDTTVQTDAMPFEVGTITSTGYCA